MGELRLKNDFSKEEQNTLITEILKEREYLYLHFPDGTKLSLSQSFLNRVRAELDFFLKDITLSKKILSSE